MREIQEQLFNGQIELQNFYTQKDNIKDLSHYKTKTYLITMLIGIILLFLVFL